jgi:methionyl aminopeptidase
MVSLKSRGELATMREAGRVVARVLAAVSAEARPGRRLIELDHLAADLIRSLGAKPSFLGYKPTWSDSPYPGVVCLSVNDAIVHGIPGKRVLKAGDLLSIDCGAYVDGLHGDAAITVAVEEADVAGRRLMDTTRRALEAGIAAARSGARIGDIAHAVETVSRGAGYGIPDGLGGHGIGRKMHEEPTVPNTGTRGKGMPLRVGMTIAIEPMLIEGGDDGYRLKRDGWTIVTNDGSRAAHFEHTIAIGQDGPEILTLP